MAEGQTYSNKLTLDTDEAVGGLNQFNAALKQSAKEAGQLSSTLKQTSSGMGGLDKATKRASLGMAQNLNLVSELALGMGALDPRLRSVGVGLASAGNNAFAFAGFLGPVGVAVATLASALPFVIGAIDSFSTSTRTATQETDNFTDALGSALSRIQSVNRAEQLRQRVANNSGTVQEQEARLELATRTLEAVERGRRAHLDAIAEVGVSNNRELTRLNRMVNAERQRVEAAREGVQLARDQARFAADFAADIEVAEGEQAIADERRQARDERRRRNRRGSHRNPELEMAIAVAQKRLALEQRITDEQARRQQAAEDAESRITDLINREIEAEDRRAALLDRQLKSRQTAAHEAAKDEAADKRKEKAQEALSLKQDIFNRQLGMTMDITQAIASAALQANEDQSKSFKTLIDEWLKSYAVQQGWLALGAFAEGVFNLVTNPPAAATKFIAGAQHAAIAAAAGGVSAAIPNEASGAAASAGTGAAPGTGGGGGGGGNTTVLINTPVAESEAGRTTNRWLRSAEDRDGLRQ